ncbi:GAF domain-containing protein [Urechidicola vernalis]|uniref:GAF domain-containing protein n=1 Tax=Urechidicola vernalis TaxID=3075600 RepID=A0ABU2Y627_9FLAO|nr:GAF domain-containing protein [Urechidicola sp. P050]MDT0553657.1 GAF domain-containing protein [Urechidicola sp. P050]
MDRINVLEGRNDRFKVFTKELLAETNDQELQEIVKKAADELSSPIALVSLVLDHIQFFKAFVGLPDDLASARGTHRDVSFCQFVVRYGEPFEVNDAPNDSRIPQHVVKEYDIQSYLGVPILVEDVVVGSLCVLDFKKRGFTVQDKDNLQELSLLVNKRLVAITKERKHKRLDLTEATLKPALSELSQTFKPIQQFINQGYSAVASIRSFILHSKYKHRENTQESIKSKLYLEAASEANQLNESLLREIEFAIRDGEDCVAALEQLILNIESTKLSEIIISAQDLSRNATNLIGGFSLPDFKSDPLIYTKGNWAIAIITNCLLIISSELHSLNSSNGIQLVIKEKDKNVELLFTAIDMKRVNIKNTLGQMKKLLEKKYPTFSFDSVEEKIRIIFKTKEI